jgi:hypothetical protein
MRKAEALRNTALLEGIPRCGKGGHTVACVEALVSIHASIGCGRMYRQPVW